MADKENKITMNEIISLVSEIIVESDINELTSINNCMNWDSLSHALIIASISDRYGVKVTPLEFTKLISVKLIYNFLNKSINWLFH